ncbi:Flp family type IVb pilin [Desertibacillus haloalkaliphilus]|uniref:Flp family type IVb pilin n=1 Tax=Desertibacillus haloalkaliphilus TaxID=1328930 RepID=UPI001FE6189F|nr:Flp family type IVb pilin [Desertibacillus haloalkaliphilus]
MKNLLYKLLREEKGQGMTEYGLILGVIAAVGIGIFFTFGETITDRMQSIIDSLTNDFNQQP